MLQLRSRRPPGQRLKSTKVIIFRNKSGATAPSKSTSSASAASKGVKGKGKEKGEEKGKGGEGGEKGGKKSHVHAMEEHDDVRRRTNRLKKIGMSGRKERVRTLT